VPNPAHFSALAAAIVLLAACRSQAPHSGGADGDATILRGHGVAVTIPGDWDGEISWLSPDYARVVHLATFPLPAELDGRGHDAERHMSGDDVYVNVGLDPGLAAPGPLPLEITRAGLRTEWEGKVPEAAARAATHLLVNGHLIQVWVTFGALPDDATLAQVNRVLRSITARPA
jgi:hypothetical protein